MSERRQGMSLFDELRENHVDVDEGLDRMMGNEPLYQAMLVKLLEMLESFTAEPEFDCKDNTEIIEKVHAIKGATGNLAVTPLFKSYSEILGYLREGKPKQAKMVYQETLPIQEKIITCINKYKI